MRQKNWQISVAFIAIILGMLLAIQFKSQQSISEATPTRRVEEIAVMLKKTKESRIQLEEKINKQKKQLESDKNMSGENSAEYDRLRVLAGLTAMQGPGIIINLNENNERTPNNLNAVQDEDLLRTVNELKAAGAEAISINGQRIVATSEIRWAGSNIIVNNTAINTPYEIKAIGNAKKLEGALKLENGIIDTLAVWGIKIKINNQEKIDIPPYRGTVKFNKAVMVEKD